MANAAIFIIVICVVIFFLKLNGLITVLILGGLGVALGSIASDGWAIYGGLIGGLIGISIMVNRSKSQKNSLFSL